MHDTLNSQASSAASIVQAASLGENARAAGVFTATCMRVVDSHRDLANSICERMNNFIRLAKTVPAMLQAEFDALPREQVWADTFPNIVTTVGGNDMLDKYLAGSAYTAAMYMGVIGAVGYASVPVIGDTAASHATWTEAGATNAPNYTIAGGSAVLRAVCAWSAATAKSKALSAPLVFSFTNSGTAKGSFISTIQTKDTATGTLFSAGLFTAGDRAVTNGDTVSVSYSLSV